MTPANLTIAYNTLTRHYLRILRDKNTSHRDYWTTMDHLGYHLITLSAGKLRSHAKPIPTPLAENISVECLDDTIINIVKILGAGDGFSSGMSQLNVPHLTTRRYPVAMARDETTLEPEMTYRRIKSELAQGPVMLTDPMLATGNTLVFCIDELLNWGVEPENIRTLHVLASRQGVQQMLEKHPKVQVFTVGYDEADLTDEGFIYPGLGDAGDRYYGC